MMKRVSTWYASVKPCSFAGTAAWFWTGLAVVVAWAAWTLHPVGTGHDLVVSERASMFYMWNIWWVYQALVVERSSPYFTTYNGYPSGVSLHYHNLVLPLGFFSLPVMALGVPVTRVYLLWLWGLPLLGYGGMYALLRRLRAPPAGAAAGAVFFLIHPFMRLSLGAPDVYAFVLVPWIVLTVLQLPSRPGYWILVPSCLAGILLVAYPYFGAGILILWGLGLPMCTKFDLGWAKYLSLGPLALLLTSFHWLPKTFGDPSIPVPQGNYFYLDALFQPPELLWWVSRWPSLWEPLRYSATARKIRHFPPMYVGLIALFLAGYVCVKRRSWTVAWGLIAAGVFFSLAVGKGLVVGGETVYMEGFTPYTLALGLFDSLRAFRVVRRLVLFDFFLLAVGLGLFAGWTSRWKYLLFVVVIAEVVCVPVQDTKALPPREELEAVRETVRAPALVPIPMTKHFGSEASYGQIVHRRKFPLVAISYVPDRLEGYLTSNPVLRAVYRKEPLPDEGWEALEDEGYGGVILHRRPFLNRLARFWWTMDAPDPWFRVRRRWRKTLRERFGEPAVENEFFELYRFGRT